MASRSVAFTTVDVAGPRSRQVRGAHVDFMCVSSAFVRDHFTSAPIRTDKYSMQFHLKLLMRRWIQQSWLQTLQPLHPNDKGSPNSSFILTIRSPRRTCRHLRIQTTLPKALFHIDDQFSLKSFREVPTSADGCTSKVSMS